VGNGVQACRRENGCARYSPVTACGTGSMCQGGVCTVQGSSGKANLYVGPETICYLSNGDILCEISLCNGGSVAAGGSTLKFFLDAPAGRAGCADPSIPGEMWQTMTGIGPASCSMSAATTFFDDPTPGSHTLALFADGLCEADEADENDNYVELTPALNVPAPMQAELWFDSTSSLNWDATNNQMWGDIRVCNFGTAAAGQFYVDFNPNEPSTPGCDYTGTEFHSFAGLAAGACSETWTTMHHAPGAGFWKTAKVIVDTNCAVVESNESNIWSWDYY
jgi:hypothetical protein